MKPTLTYDIFCDASVGPNLRGTCSGALITRREERPGSPNSTFVYMIQPEGTNNSGEIGAIALAVNQACTLRRYGIHQLGIEPKFHIFSDSLISIQGVRDWLPNWIKNADENGNLRNSSKKVVANQEFFKYIYNTIATIDNIDITFFHQDAHVTKNFDTIRVNFKKFNHIDLELVGLTPETICIANDFVDRETRGIINNYLALNPNIRDDCTMDKHFKAYQCDELVTEPYCFDNYIRRVSHYQP